MSPRHLTKINRIDPAELKQLKKRIDIATAVIIFFIALLIARIWFLQIHMGTDYEGMSENNRIRVQDIAAPRGNILDRHERIIITNRPRFNVVWTREDAPDPDAVVKQLAKILDEDISVLLDRIRAGADHPRYMPTRLKEDIDWKTLVYIENNHYDLPGVRIEVLPSRDYLYKDLASHIIGYLGEINPAELEKLKAGGSEGGDQIGKMGVEKLFENVLRGEKGRNYLEVDVHGFEQQQIKIQEPLPGNDIQLTIDVDIQQTAEQALADKAGAIVVMEVNSGKIIALASTPPLRLEDFIGGISSKSWNELLNNPLKPLINKTIQGQYPPGSTYKIITALAALSEKVVTPDSVFYCSGSFFFGNRRYGCWKRGGHGAVNLHRALMESCDVYFYNVGQKLGVDALARYAQRFGLGRETGIELEHEKAGLVPTSDWKLKKYKEAWQEGETLSVAIGQGFNLATPLQICLMTSAMVNGGNLYKPLLIEAVKDPEGTTLQKFLPVAVASDLGNKEWLGLIKDALVAVVNDKHGTAKGAKLKEVTVGGKTGTSQVVRLSQLKDLSEKDIPYKYRDHAWFTAFAPAEKPEIAVTVMIEHGGGGGANAAPVAKIVLERYFELQGVLPSEDESQPVAHPVTEPEIMVPQGQKVKKKVL
jgi:penicillin-binding protein 2